MTTTTAGPPVYYMKCDCHVWPLVYGARIGSCGRCGVVPHTRATDEEIANRDYSRGTP